MDATDSRIRSDPIRSRSPCDCIRTSYAGSGWVYIWNEQVMRLLPAATTTANKRRGGWGGVGGGGRTSTILATMQRAHVMVDLISCPILLLIFFSRLPILLRLLLLSIWVLKDYDTEEWVLKHSVTFPQRVWENELRVCS
jgi:hypothetical protein